MKNIRSLAVKFLHSLRGGCYLLLVAGGVSLFASCDYEAKYTLRKVELTITELRTSAGFAHFLFESNEPTYFLTGIVEATDATILSDIEHYQDKFMLLMLDSAYIDYLNWRHDRLEMAVHDIADFRDHTLKYTEANQYFQFLKPDTRYFVFAFVVDPVLRQPVGDLHLQEIRTAPESVIPTYFSYRINGYWDYIYPLEQVLSMVDDPIHVDSVGQVVVDSTHNGEVRIDYQLITDVPWVVATVDSSVLREEGWSHPGAFFIDSFTTVSNATSRDNVRVLYGLYAHNNDGVGDGTSNTLFEDGHTYYTGIASLDGPMIGGNGEPMNYAIYRFTWHGPDTQYMFEPGDPADTRGAW